MALAVTLTAWTAFAPSSGPSTISVACRNAVCAQMVTVPEVYDTYYSSLPSTQRTMTDTTGPVAQGAMGAVVAGAAAVGYFGLTTISSRVAVNAVHVATHAIWCWQNTHVRPARLSGAFT